MTKTLDKQHKRSYNKNVQANICTEHTTGQYIRKENQQRRESITGRTTSYGSLELPDIKQTEQIRRIDYGCAQCLHEAGKLSAYNVLSAIIQNELSPVQRRILTLYWYQEEKKAQIARELGCSVDKVRKELQKSESIIRNSLKYVMLYNYLLSGKEPLPENFHIKIINCVNGKELIS